MHPKPKDGQLGIAVEFVKDVNTLNNLPNISQVENIM